MSHYILLLDCSLPEDEQLFAIDAAGNSRQLSGKSWLANPKPANWYIVLLPWGFADEYLASKFWKQVQRACDPRSAWVTEDEIPF